MFIGPIRKIISAVFLAAVVVASLSIVISSASSASEQPSLPLKPAGSLFGYLNEFWNPSSPAKADPGGETSKSSAVIQATSNFYLHGTGDIDNPPTLFLDKTVPTATEAKFKDSPAVKFNGGNPWKEVGTWSASPEVSRGTLNNLSDLHVWLGLKKSDDEGTNFDVQVEVYKNTTLLTSGLTRCVTGLTKNDAKEVAVPVAPFSQTLFNGTDDALFVKILTRIGTNASGATCGGTSNSVGLRLYFDAVDRTSRIGANVVADAVPPTITASVSPAPNAAGWNNSDPTVTFTCADSDSGIAFCSEPIVISSETAGQIVVGTAIDQAGNTASVSVTVKLDKTAPSVAVTSPASGAQIFASPINVDGTASDAFSGLSSVSCSGVPALINGSSFNCSVALTPNANLINATALDVAGNSSTFPLSLTFTPSPTVRLTAPAHLSYLNLSPTTVTGTVDDPTATITINSIQAPVANGQFSAQVPLAEGPNIITATATSAAGAVGNSSIEVTLDTTPPRVNINTPADKFVTTEDSITVSGSINDIVVGTVNDEQAQVTVNGTPAQVANRLFLATNIPLSLGDNVIQAVGQDRVGNAGTTQITVTRQAPPPSRIRVISGNNQTGTIGSLLPAPLVVAVTDANGNPSFNKPVIFKVTQDDGMVNAVGPPAPTVITNTDAQGLAQVQWKLGMRAGAGSDGVEAYVVGVSGTAIFTATATQGPAGNIVIDTGNDQIGEVNQPLPRPFIAVVVDNGNNRLAGVPVTFTVKEGGGSFGGEPSVTVVSDSDGRVAATMTLGANEGNANNLVEATFPANQKAPVSFTASGRVAGDPSKTTISGVVLDNSNVPIPGVTIRAVLTNLITSNSSIIQSVASVQTDEQGQFKISQAPVGFVELLVDGSTAQLPGKFPTLDYDMVTVAGQDNTLGLPIYLLPLKTSNELCVTATTGGGTLTIPEAPGFSLTFGPGQVTFPGGSKEGCVNVTVVHGDKVPMVPGFGQQPRFIVTIQPSGAMFNIPAAITLPNVDGLRPRAVTEMYSFDHDIGSFVAIGTGVVSDDGLVIRSSPGVGVLKAGWHCGGDPNQSGGAGSLSVTLSAASAEVPAGNTVDMTANGSPPQDGKYINWEVIDDPGDPDDDPTVASFETSPTCDGQPSCTAKLKGTKIGTVSVRVSFLCTTTGNQVTSSIVKVKFKIGLTPKEVSFTSDIDIFKDQVGSAPQIMDPVWKDTNTPDQNDPVAYVRNSAMKVTVKFGIDPVPANPINNVTIEGEIPGLGKFKKTGVTIPAASEMTVTDIVADTNLPNTTKFFDPLTINWRHMADGASCPKCTEDGSSSHKVYVTLATPLRKVFLTSLKFAVADGGAADQTAAFQKTWAQFAGPANVKSWDNRRLYYYRDGVPFVGCALTEEQLLTAANGSGQCGSFAHLLIGSLGINGITGEFTQIHSNDGTGFMVKDWLFGTPSFPTAAEFKWRLTLNPTAVTAGDLMVPKQPGDIYGDLTSRPTLAGQNTSPPSEKIFGAHFIVKVTLPGVSPSYYDPSYGVFYLNADDFENKAIDGYMNHFPGDPFNVFRVRKSTGLRNINFDR